MTLLYRSEIFQKHDTGHHPESNARLIAIDKKINQHPAAFLKKLGQVHSATTKQLNAVHDVQQIALAEQISNNGGGFLDVDTAVSADSFNVAKNAAGTACTAIDDVVSGKDNTGLCLIRPPGHHATESRSMGFCIFNNIAVAARHAIDTHKINRILIVDWDVHHGNGTQDIFYENDQVMFFSIHRSPFYPGTGGKTETGQGRGLGYTLNAPVAFGTSRQDYLDIFEKHLHAAAAKIKPELVLISAGFDAHHQDPIGSLGLLTEDFQTLTQKVKEVASLYAKGRICSYLEGGYDVGALSDCVATHFQSLAHSSF